MDWLPIRFLKLFLRNLKLKKTNMSKPFYQKDLESLNIEIDVTDKPLDISNEEHMNYVKRLSSFFKALKQGQKKGKAVWQPVGEWLDYNNEKNFFYNLLLKDKHHEVDEMFRNFWRNKLG